MRTRRAGGTARALAASGAVVTVGVMPVFLVGGLAVQLRQALGLGPTLLGLVASLFFAAGAVSARLLATLTERVGPSVAMRLSALGSALCLFAMAAISNATWLLIVIAIAGVVNSLSQPACNELLMRRVPATKRGFAFAVKQSAIPVATLSAGLAVPAVALTIGWRWVFGIAGGLAVVAALGVPHLPWTRPERHARERGRSAGSLLALLSIGTGFGAAAANAMGAFVTVSAVQVGYEPAHAGLILALGSAVGLTGRLGAGVVSDRLRPNLLRLVIVMALVGSVGFLLIASGDSVLFVVGLVLGFGSGWAWQGVFNFAVAARFPDRVAAATAVTQTGVYVGGAAGPLIFGLLAAHVSMTSAWLAAFTMMLLAAASIFLAQRRGDGSRGRHRVYVGDGTADQRERDRARRGHGG